MSSKALKLVTLAHEVPAIVIAAIALFCVGSIAGAYVAYRSKGWKGLFPFIKGRSRFRAYRRGIRKHGWWSLPLFIWIVCQPLGIALALYEYFTTFRN